MSTDLLPLTTSGWPCDHEVRAVEARRARRSCAPLLPQEVEAGEASPQFLTTMAYWLGLEGGIACPVCLRELNRRAAPRSVVLG
jgi:hypothetical protein